MPVPVAAVSADMPHSRRSCPELPASLRGISVASFKAEMLTRGIIDPNGRNPHSRFNEITKGLKVRKLAAERDGRIWPILKGE
jgi:hypothetical protein